MESGHSAFKFELVRILQSDFTWLAPVVFFPQGLSVVIYDRIAARSEKVKGQLETRADTFKWHLGHPVQRRVTYIYQSCHSVTTFRVCWLGFQLPRAFPIELWRSEMIRIYQSDYALLLSLEFGV